MAAAGGGQPGMPPGPNMAGGGLNPATGGAVGSMPGGQPGPMQGPGFGSNMGAPQGGGYPIAGTNGVFQMPPPQGIRNLSQVFQTQPGQQRIGMQPNPGGGANGAGGGTMQGGGASGGAFQRNPMGSMRY